MTRATWGSTDLGGTIGLLNAGTKLRVAHWPGAPGGPGTVVLATGRGEFIECYGETIADLSRLGFAVVAFDFRGQGGSARRTRRGGHIDSFSRYVDDLVAVVHYAGQLRLPQPITVVAHSMGGLVALLAQPQLAREVDRMVLLAPMLEVSELPMPRGLVGLLAGCASLVGLADRPATAPPPPGSPESFAGNRVTSDPLRYGRTTALVNDNPDLATGAPTYGWVRAALKAMRQAQRMKGKPLAIPTLFIASGADRVVSTAAIDAFARAAEGGGLVLIRGARHQLLFERDELRTLFFAAFNAFLAERPAQGARSKPAHRGRGLRFVAGAKADPSRLLEGWKIAGVMPVAEPAPAAPSLLLDHAILPAGEPPLGEKPASLAPAPTSALRVVPNAADAAAPQATSIRVEPRVARAGETKARDGRAAPTVIPKAPEPAPAEANAAADPQFQPPRVEPKVPRTAAPAAEPAEPKFGKVEPPASALRAAAEDVGPLPRRGRPEAEREPPGPGATPPEAERDGSPFQAEDAQDERVSFAEASGTPTGIEETTADDAGAVASDATAYHAHPVATKADTGEESWLGAAEDDTDVLLNPGAAAMQTGEAHPEDAARPGEAAAPVAATPVGGTPQDGPRTRPIRTAPGRPGADTAPARGGGAKPRDRARDESSRAAALQDAPGRADAAPGKRTFDDEAGPTADAVQQRGGGGRGEGRRAEIAARRAERMRRQADAGPIGAIPRQVHAGATDVDGERSASVPSPGAESAQRQRGRGLRGQRADAAAAQDRPAAGRAAEAGRRGPGPGMRRPEGEDEAAGIDAGNGPGALPRVDGRGLRGRMGGNRPGGQGGRPQGRAADGALADLPGRRRERPAAAQGEAARAPADALRPSRGLAADAAADDARATQREAAATPGEARERSAARLRRRLRREAGEEGGIRWTPLEQGGGDAAPEPADGPDWTVEGDGTTPPPQPDAKQAPRRDDVAAPAQEPRSGLKWRPRRP